MSYENRKREYARLKELGRDKDICASLKAEFEEKVAIPNIITDKKPKGRNNGRK